ncbi:transporter substrate-binding domain-containing protein [Pseudoduganella ginsengisoli]|nr:transporter substrate-binding domain-containing protein [Pseudoduganella ginsengisoli]
MLSRRHTLIFFASLCAAGAAPAEEVITLSNGEWLPYMSEHAPHYGPVSRIVKEAFALEGVTVRYVFRPWNRAYAEAAAGQADGSIVWSKGLPGTARASDFLYSDTVFEGQSVFFHLKRKPFDWNSFADLSKVSVGGTAGYEYQFERLPGIHIDRAPNDELSFRKLLAGRFDIFPANADSGWMILRSRFTPDEVAQVTVHAMPYASTQYHLIMPRKLKSSARYVKLFNQGLLRLKASGKYQEYMEELKRPAQ